jgi:hypothetical protein
MQIFFNAWTIFNMNIKHERELSKFTSQRSSKFTMATMKDGLSLAMIFATNGKLYITITKVGCNLLS